MTYTAMGILRFNSGFSAEALALYRRAENLYEALVREHPEVGDYAHRRGMVLSNLGLARVARRRSRRSVCARSGWPSRSSSALASRNPLVGPYQSAVAGRITC